MATVRNEILLLILPSGNISILSVTATHKAGDLKTKDVGKESELKTETFACVLPRCWLVETSSIPAGVNVKSQRII